MIRGARRHGRPLSVAMIDIDHSKGVNDAYGLDAGDAALVGTTIAFRVADPLAHRALRRQECGSHAVSGAENLSASLPRRT